MWATGVFRGERLFGEVERHPSHNGVVEDPSLRNLGCGMGSDWNHRDCAARCWAVPAMATAVSDSRETAGMRRSLRRCDQQVADPHWMFPGLALDP
jgi:hypothetical protein